MQFTGKTVALQGVEAFPIDVQCQLSRGPHFISIVGLPDKAVKEAKERIMAAFYAHSLSLPPMKITINLSPSDIPKTGSHYDLPMAIAILTNMEMLPREEMERMCALGELSLDGRLQAVSGVLAAALEASANGQGLICPPSNMAEARLLSDLEVLAPKRLVDLIQHFRGHPIAASEAEASDDTNQNPRRDLAEIKGLKREKRALEIAAAGRHHLFMVGAPGAGKSLLASCLPSIMPPMTAGEILETTLVHSAAGMLTNKRPVLERPYFDPHHTASAAAIIGGGKNAGPGEISLAHNGVLFLDELPEFKRDVLESLRQPLETATVLVARASAHSSYPARFLLVAAANPCQCGMMFDPEKWCGQAPICGQKYMGRLSGPLLDRFSLRIAVQALSPQEITSLPRGETSDIVCKRVSLAREKQYARNGIGVANEDLNNVALDQEIENAPKEVLTLLMKAMDRFSLSPRGYYRLIKVARSIADLAGADHINEDHVAEAVTYRLLESEAASYNPNKAVAKWERRSG